MKLAKIAAIAALSLTTSLSVAAPTAQQSSTAQAGSFNLGNINGLNPGNFGEFSTWLRNIKANGRIQPLAKFFNANKTSIEKGAGTFMTHLQHEMRTKGFGKHMFMVDSKSRQVLKDPTDLYTGKFLKQVSPHADASALFFVKADKDDVKSSDFSNHQNLQAVEQALQGFLGAHSGKLNGDIRNFVKGVNPDMVKKGSDEELLAIDGKTKRVVFDSTGKHENLFMKQMPDDSTVGGMLLFNAAHGEISHNNFANTAEEADTALDKNGM
jgi:hypothetical protein